MVIARLLHRSFCLHFQAKHCHISPMTGHLPCDRPVTLRYVRKVGLRQNHVRWCEAAIASDCNIFDCAVWSKDYIYEFVCPDCSIRGIALIMMGALFGLVWLVLSSSVLLLAIRRYKRWLPVALALFWTAGCLMDGVQQFYKAWLG
jgi:hypothetical protein